ncbi:MAG: hypothetical protein AAF634_10185 [Bacteroidota bacterium]
MKIFIPFCFLLLAIACQKPSNTASWQLVLKTDKDGSVIAGSKTALIEAIRKGSDLKIGWGAKREALSIEHLSEPIWLAVLSEKEVMAHLDPQVLSGIDWDTLNANYKDLTLLQKEWRVVLTTKGDFDAVWYDRKADTIIRRWPQKHIMSWFVRGGTSDKAVPLFSKQ